MAGLAGFRSVRGHDAAVSLLRRAIANDRVSSVYLFAGPSGVGKDRLAHALAQTMNCRARTDDGDACGACEMCLKTARAMHPDVIVLQRELKDPPKDAARDNARDRAEAEALRTRRREEIPESDLRPNITVEQIEELLARMPFRPHEGATRWVIFREADRLLPAAANKLLKTLEEPPRDTHFVLVTARPSALLTTIRSRCQTVRFGLLAPDDVAAVLREGAESLSVDPAHVDDLVALGDGSVGRALEFRDREAHKARQAMVDEVLNALRAGSPGVYVTLGERAKELDRHDLDTVLLLLQRYFRHEALQHASARPRQAAVNAARADIVRDTQSLLDGGATPNVQLVLQAMLVRLREARA